MIARLQEALKGAGVRAKIIYSGGMDVDILPEGASKGEGLKFLLRQVSLAAGVSAGKFNLSLQPLGDLADRYSRASYIDVSMASVNITMLQYEHMSGRGSLGISRE